MCQCVFRRDNLMFFSTCSGRPYCGRVRAVRGGAPPGHGCLQHRRLLCRCGCALPGICTADEPMGPKIHPNAHAHVPSRFAHTDGSAMTRDDHNATWRERVNTHTHTHAQNAPHLASTSITGSDPKLQARAVDVVRMWAQKGVLVVYVTARPSIQHGTSGCVCVLKTSHCRALILV